MTGTGTAREALIAEAIGDVAQLLARLEALAPVLDDACQALRSASTTLQDELTGFERRMAALTEHAQKRTARHLAARAEDAARLAIDQQGRAMADAARLAFGVEVGAALQRLQATLQPLLEARKHPWRPWLTHSAVAAVAAGASWALNASAALLR